MFALSWPRVCFNALALQLKNEFFKQGVWEIEKNKKSFFCNVFDCWTVQICALDDGSTRFLGSHLILFCRVNDFWAFVHMDLNVTSMSPFVCNMWMIHHLPCILVYCRLFQRPGNEPLKKIIVEWLNGNDVLHWFLSLKWHHLCSRTASDSFLWRTSEQDKWE